jgi:peroxiredoxin
MFPVAATLFVIALWCSGRLLGWLPPELAATGSWQSDLLGKPAPGFTFTTTAGTSSALSQEKGHVVLIDFWGSGCPPCRVELKQSTAALAADPTLRNRGLRVWTIDEDDDAAASKKFMDDNRYNFDVMLDAQGTIWTQYHGYGIPDTFIIGRDGVVRYASAGFGPSIDDQLHAAIESALK